MTATQAGDKYPVQRVGYQSAGEYDHVQAADIVKTTKIVLEDFDITITSVTTGNGVGGRKIFEFPKGFIKRLGCRAVLSCSVVSAEQADYTDGTPEGDLGIGTAVPADADALGTDATDDDWGTATAFTMNNFEDASVIIPSEADGVHDGSAAPVELFLNALVDAADIDDGVTTTLRVNGTVWITWVNQGGA